ncbi:hypothetical protein RDABS01_026854 [Bienertia sinuspersici]
MYWYLRLGSSYPMHIGVFCLGV